MLPFIFVITNFKEHISTMIPSANNVSDRRALQQEQLCALKEQIEELSQEVKSFQDLAIKITALDRKLSDHIDNENKDVVYIKKQFEEIKLKMKIAEELKEQLNGVRGKIVNIESSIPPRLDTYEKTQADFEQVQKLLLIKHEALEESISMIDAQFNELKTKNEILGAQVNQILSNQDQNSSEHVQIFAGMNEIKPKIDEIWDIMTAWKGFNKMVGWISENAKKITLILALLASLGGTISWMSHYIQSNFIIKSVDAHADQRTQANEHNN